METGCCGGKNAQPVEKVDYFVLYRPLIILTVLALLVAATLFFGRAIPFMACFMGTALLFLAMLKLFNLAGFVQAYQRYDIVAERWPGYGWLYPFIELALALCLLGGIAPLPTNIAVLVLFGIGTVGVYRTVRSAAKVQCGCVGTGFNLPVGRVTLAENILMMAMAGMEIIACIR